MGASGLFFDKALTAQDIIVLKNLEQDIQSQSQGQRHISTSGSAKRPGKDVSPREGTPNNPHSNGLNNSQDDISRLKSMRDANSQSFEPTVLLTVDHVESRLPPKSLLRLLLRHLRGVARHETDVVMVLHLALYFVTSVPSAVLLYKHFTYVHGFLHLIMQLYYTGSYTLMMHQHIHQRGILSKRFALVDRLFPYITDPLMGHSWNTYYYHHVKHHHVEGNGPGDLSSTMRYQRDSIVDLLSYIGRFYFLIWLDLPLYFVRTRRLKSAFRAAWWELSTFLFYFIMARLFGGAPTFFVYVAPLMVMRAGFMVGNWGQHAFVDPDEPTSDFRSSITLIDVPSNRFCYNDGYHTSHHLNPRRHWRDHPISFLEQKETYAKEGALVFHNIDFLMITVRLMMKDYEHLARCLVPMGDQIQLTLEGRVQLLRRLTRKFTEEDMQRTFPST